MSESIEVCNYFINYLLIGVAYAIVVEINYRREDALIEKDPDLEYSLLGDLFQMIVLGSLNTLFWPKSIADEMIDAHLQARALEEEDEDK